MITILWGKSAHELTRELRPSSERAAWTKYRELIMFNYVALEIDGEVVAHNLEEGPICQRGANYD